MICIETLFIPLIWSYYFLKSNSHLPPKNYLLHWKPFKYDEKWFFFILKALSVLTVFLSWIFFHVEKNNFLRRLRLISKCMTSQPGKQTITMHIFPKISRSKDNRKFCQLTKYTKVIFFFKNHVENQAGRVVPDHF